ncbi:MAG: hypothetical protein Q7V01_13320 [Vicinamibacterales bacterium]|nr:hypothetical protein [Vicinamibacterales bacterium]
MREVLAALLAFLIGFQPTAALATPQAAAQPGAPPQRQAAASQPTVETLGVSDRIRRQLRVEPDRGPGDRGPLKLDFYVEVQGIAPPIQLFTPEDFRLTGPVPGAPPTHREMVRELWTKPEFKGQSVPLSSLAILGIMKLAQWQAEEAKRRKAEAERKKRDDELKAKYPDLVIK